jgi:transcriptional regulator with XRE-family HTH domain
MERWWDRYGDFSPGEFAGYPAPEEVVAWYREQRGLSQAELATLLGVTANAVYRLERYGVFLTEIARLRQLQRLLALPPELLGLADPPGVGEWWREEYGVFPVGEDGFPDAGSVVKHYRKLKKHSRKPKEWSQSDLADALGFSLRGIRDMENRSLYLSTVTRRRALHIVLGIPPVLLGLDAVHLLPVAPVESVASVSVASVSVPDLAIIRMVQEGLWTSYYVSHGQDQVAEARSALALIKDTLPSLSATELPTWLEQQSLLYQGLVNVIREYAEPSKVLAYAEKGVKAAREAKNTDLEAVASTRQVTTLYLLGQEERAVKLARAFDQDSANDPVVAAGRLRTPLSLARVLALDATDQADRSQVLSLIDEQNWSPFVHPSSDMYNLRRSATYGLVQSAETLLNLSVNAPDASRLLGQAQNMLDRVDLEEVSSSPIRLQWLKLIQARVALAKREYEYAAALAVEAFVLMKQIKSVLDLPEFVGIYQTLRRSSYASEPMVGRLGVLLLEAGIYV